MFTPHSVKVFGLAFAVSLNLVLAESVWLEAEEPVEKTSNLAIIPFVSDNNDLAASNMSVVQLQTHTKGPHYVKYEFQVGESGDYNVYIATTSPNQAWSSPFEVFVDGEPVQQDWKLVGQPYGNTANPGLFQWQQTEVELSKGEHTLEFRISEPRDSVFESDNGEPAYSFLADAILVTNENITPDGPEKPAKLLSKENN